MTEAEERLLQVVSVAIVTTDHMAFFKQLWAFSNTKVAFIILALQSAVLSHT